MSFFRASMPAPPRPMIMPGLAVKMFTVAGPVIVFGTLASVVYGVVLMLMG